MRVESKNIIRCFIGLWLVLAAIHCIQYLFQELAIKEESLVIASSDLNALQEFNYASDLFDMRCIYKHSSYKVGNFVCPVTDSSKSIEFHIGETILLKHRKTVLDFCEKRHAMIGHLQMLREYVVEKNIPTDTIDIVYFRDVVFLLLDYIEAIKNLSSIRREYSIEIC